VLLVAALAPLVPASATGRFAWVEVPALAVCATGAAYGWMRHRRLCRADAATVTVLATVAALDRPALGLWTLLGGLCATALLRPLGITIPWLSWDGRRRRWVGAAVAVPVGVALAEVNVLLARASSSSGPAGGAALHGLFDALRAGLSEEIGIRLCLLALCVHLLGRLPRTRTERLLTYLVLVVPHAALHHVQAPSQLIVGTTVMGVAFGLPLAVLLTRFGVLAAVTAHTVMDAVRFVVLGL